MGPMGPQAAAQAVTRAVKNPKLGKHEKRSKKEGSKTMLEMIAAKF